MAQEVFSDKLKKIDKKTCAQLLVVLMFPLLLCILVCAFRGINFFTLYAPSSINNDSLIYYKLVDGVLSPGGMKGYFGFNETHSDVGGFAAWNPVILLPWLCFGRLFGWNYISPIIYNIVLFSLALTVFVGLSKMNIKQTACMLVALAVYPSFSLHLMSVLPEINLAAIMLLYLGSILGYVNFNRKFFLYLSLVFCIFLAICRPYFLLLFLIPMFYFIRSKSKYGWIFPTIAIVIAILGYYFTTKKMTAEYFRPLYDMSLLEDIKNGQISSAFSTAIEVFKEMVYGIRACIIEAFRYGLTSGTQYFVSILASALLMTVAIGKKNRGKRFLYMGIGCSYICVLMAIILFLRLTNEGARHSFVFSLTMLVLIFTAEFDVLFAVRVLIMIAPLVIFDFKGAFVPTDYDIPAKNVDIEARVEYLSDVFRENMIINDSKDADGYENTVIWLLIDTVDGNSVVTDYNALYAVPASMGINCCMPDYVINNVDSLQSKYIAVVKDGTVDKLLMEKDYTIFVSIDRLVVYRHN